MNIKSAIEQVTGAVRAYLATNEHGLYLVPERMQRPIIMMGPPGIGKTAIVSQVAEELGVNFVSYSITHHTRQSALGLPYISEAEFGGRSWRVSRYTMSEIIAATYDAIEASGVREGILFLDEINCASETLMPAMLQFLQYKTFGEHALPHGWAIVCAGNPPEYNRAARDFDPAMMDRMKRIDVEPDLDVWMDYAVSHGVHPAITSYLANKPKNFYRVRASVTGPRLVTARGWEDLSRMLVAYRHEGLGAGMELVSQYLQDKEVAEDFSLYLELFERYQDDYKVDQILAGAAGPEIARRAREARFDERLALVNLLLEALLSGAHEADAEREALTRLREDLPEAEGEPLPLLEELAQGCQAELERARSGSACGARRQLMLALRAEAAERLRAQAARAAAGGRAGGFDAKGHLDELLRAEDLREEALAAKLDCALGFADECLSGGQELLLFMTHLSVDPSLMRVLTRHGSAEFVRQSTRLMLHERGEDLAQLVDELDLG